MLGRSRSVSYVGAAAVAVAASFVLAPTAGTPAHAHNAGVAEYVYGLDDAYVAQRVQEVTDTNDVLLAVEWKPEVDGTVNAERICLDIPPAEINQRLPLSAYLWRADGTLLAAGSASEGISGVSGTCFYDIFHQSVAVQADQHYVSGFWVRGGQYSYVPHGLDISLSNATVGHLIVFSNDSSTVGAGNGLFVYTSLEDPADPPFPTDSWQNSDYLISPRFTSGPH